MSQPDRTRHIQMLRRWQQRLARLAILFAIAGAIALAWSLLAGDTRTAAGGGSTFTLSGYNAAAAAGTSASGAAAAAAATGTVSGTSRTTATGTGSGSGSGVASGTSSGAASGTSSEAGSGTSSGSSPGTGSGSSPGTGTSQARGILPRVASEDDIPVYLVGAVARPGIYIIRRGSYLYELVDLAGGLTPDAAATAVNLALRLSENQMVRIPTQSEAADPFYAPSPIYSPASASESQARPVNINTASAEELETLPGIGPATATAIVADRKRNGPFARPEDIMRVAGVKESRYAQLEPLISVR